MLNIESIVINHCSQQDDDRSVVSRGSSISGTALTSISNLSKMIKPMKSARTTTHFDFDIAELPILRNIDRRVDLNNVAGLEYLSSGSNSEIYSAVWDNQRVIVKMLSEKMKDDRIAIFEFDIEFELLSRLDHPNITAILGGGILPRPFIIMERLRDLSSVLDINFQETQPKFLQRKAFSFFEMLNLAKDLSLSLRYLHAEVHPDGVILHRDLKPDNMGLTADGKLKLYDFGLCRCVKKRSCNTQSYEMTGNTGSLRFMAPEVVLGKAYNEKVDVYSFAVIVWLMATNKAPFKGYDRSMHRSRVVHGGERPKCDSDWPREFIDLLEACWHESSVQRPSFSQISDLLEDILESKMIRSKEKTKEKAKGFTTTLLGKIALPSFTKRAAP
mmetsp:Transcript_34524/g.32891  ORF Transcript_34524/g.32891 Transcript_34524/m.32891 type:complete len:387 (-) Transcript_34524:298-1458(-)